MRLATAIRCRHTLETQGFALRQRYTDAETGLDQLSAVTRAHTYTYAAELSRVRAPVVANCHAYRKLPKKKTGSARSRPRLLVPKLMTSGADDHTRRIGAGLGRLRVSSRAGPGLRGSRSGSCNDRHVLRWAEALKR